MADRLHTVSDYTSEHFLNLLQAPAVKQDTDVNICKHVKKITTTQCFGWEKCFVDVKQVYFV